MAEPPVSCGVQLTVISVPVAEAWTIGVCGTTGSVDALVVAACDAPALLRAPTETSYDVPGSPVTVHEVPMMRFDCGAVTPSQTRELFGWPVSATITS